MRNINKSYAYYTKHIFFYKFILFFKYSSYVASKTGVLCVKHHFVVHINSSWEISKKFRPILLFSSKVLLYVYSKT